MNRTTLNKATSPDNNPTPAYLFDEIALVTHDAASNEDLVSYLLKRLESPNPDVKAKVLIIMKMVCRKGNPAFRHALSRNSAVIKETRNYHGAPDPLRGDEPSRRVRECAKDTLEAIFDSSKDERKDPVLAGRIQGFGTTPITSNSNNNNNNGDDDGTATATTTGIYSSNNNNNNNSLSRYPSNDVHYGSGSNNNNNSSTGTGRYQGIGNPAFAHTLSNKEPKGIIEKVASVVREKVEKMVEANSNSNNNNTHNLPGISGVKPPWMTSNNQQQNLPQGYSFASNRGSSSYDRSGSYDPNALDRMRAGATTTTTTTTTATSASNNNNSWTDPRSPRAPPSFTGMTARTSSNNIQPTRTSRTTEADESVVERLIDELCSPGGVRAVPPKDKLEAFCRACKTLDPNIVIRILDSKLQTTDWKVQHKSLCVLEALLRTPGLDAFADRLDETPESLEALYSSSNVSVRERATVVWKLLYEEASSAPTEEGSGMTHGSNNNSTNRTISNNKNNNNLDTQGDFLSFVSETPTNSSSNSNGNNTSNVMMEGNSLLSADLFSNNVVQQQPPPPNDLFRNMSIKASSNNNNISIPPSNTSSSLNFINNGTNNNNNSNRPLNNNTNNNNGVTGIMDLNSMLMMTSNQTHQQQLQPQLSRPSPLSGNNTQPSQSSFSFLASSNSNNTIPNSNNNTTSTYPMQPPPHSSIMNNQQQSNNLMDLFSQPNPPMMYSQNVGTVSGGGNPMLSSLPPPNVFLQQQQQQLPRSSPTHVPKQANNNSGKKNDAFSFVNDVLKETSGFKNVG
jgi:hypothetical protein